MIANSFCSDVFDNAHHAGGLVQKIKRSFVLGPKYFFFDLPRYFHGRRALNLPTWDLKALWSPLHEFGDKVWCSLPLPPHYVEALNRLHEAGVQLTIPRRRLEGLLRVWWTTRDVPGDVIECGSYRGATALLLALLGRLNHLRQNTLMLDTFAGIPATTKFDVSRRSGEFLPACDQQVVIRRQATELGVAERVEILAGLFSESFTCLEERDPRFAFAHIDANIYQGTLEACCFTIPRISTGGAAVFDDYNGPCDLGARLAIEQFFAGAQADLIPLAGSSVWTRVGNACNPNSRAAARPDHGTPNPRHLTSPREEIGSSASTKD